jgi:transcriptional regulator with XRE-family HTH domain
MSLTLELITVLKRLLKAQGVTYAHLAARLRLSEASVKRMFSRKAFTVRRLESICEILGIGLFELAEHTRSAAEPLTELSEEQEDMLLREPALLLALYLALNNWREADVLAEYTFTKPEWTRLLARLDRMRILDLMPGNRARLRTARNFRWRQHGPIQRFFERRLLPEYFSRGFGGDHSGLRLLTGMLSPATLHTLERRMHDFTREFDMLLSHDAALPISQRVGVSLVLAMRPWELSIFDRWRRDKTGSKPDPSRAL